MWRKLLHGAGCLSYLALLAAIFGVGSYVAFSLFVRGGVIPTPELVGLDDKEAEAMLADQGLGLAWSDEGDRYDDRVPAGHILMQKPRAGTLVKRGRAVTVVLSRGPQRIEVPEVIGEALQAAQVTLVAAGLRLGRTVHVFGEQPNGTVVAQRPAGGARAERDAAVDLFLSLEDSRQTFLMPDLVNHSYEEVRRFFSRRGFRLGRVSYETYDGVVPGTVLRQFPIAGHPLRRGDVIALGVVRPEAPESNGEPAR
jgi:serine/threonine-protein kinase